MSPHLVVELKPFHVHTQELGVYFKPSRLLSRGDVKDHISETIKNRIQNRDPLPLTRATPDSSTQGCSTQAVLCATQSQEGNKTNDIAIKKNTFESVLMRWMKLEPIIQMK